MPSVPTESSRPAVDLDLDRRHIWATVRAWMELDNNKRLRQGGKRRNHWDLFETLVRIFGVGLRVLGLWDRGVRNALDLRLHTLRLSFAGLPESFDGYRILHITDPHFDSNPALTPRLAEMIGGISADLCVLTGDYRKEIHGSFVHIYPHLERVVESLNCPDGVLATLGNHDTVHMVNAIEDMGVRVLANETVSIHRDAEALHVTGTDDVHYFYTDMALEAMQQCPEGFRIALVHSPELYDIAAEHGYALYLSGHTHGGQICLPGGRPLILHLNHGRAFARGLWRHRGMVGYTSTGAGTSALPVRFHSRGEITLIELRRDNPDSSLTSAQ